jgi:hypothetical protein
MSLADIQAMKALKTAKQNASQLGVNQTVSTQIMNTQPIDIYMNLVQGTSYTFRLNSYAGVNFSRAQIFCYWDDTNWYSPKILTGLGQSFVWTADRNYVRVRFYITLNANESALSSISVSVIATNSTEGRILNNTNNLFQNQPQKLLVIGDSYSAQGYWINSLKTLMNISNVVNLGVSSATLRDFSNDRTTYPYTSRPVSTDNTGNHNTFGSQIEKLKRLMAGTDLDVGESKIYASSADYPDIILIEGGTNDGNGDASTSGYANQLYTTQSNVWYKTSGGTASQGSVNIPNAYNSSSVDRTTFMGTIYYLWGSLHVLFPNAKIFFITPSGLSYANGNNAAFQTKGSQIKTACNLLSIPAIDWGANGRLSFVTETAITGAGTSVDPYIINNVTPNTWDSLHPNTTGALMLAKVVAGVLNQNY